MQSVASPFHSQAMGIIMTGMGSDGAQGMKTIHREADSRWARTSRLVRSTPCHAFARRWEFLTGLRRYPRSLMRFSKLRATVKRTWFSASSGISRLVQDLAHLAQQGAGRKRLGQALPARRG